MSDILTYSQGQTATLTAQFVTVSGTEIDVDDATVTIIGPAAEVVLDPVAMVHLYPGFYYYDWAIPNSLPINTYTVRITGTVDGDITASITYLSVVLAGTPTVSGTTQREVGLIDALNTYINPINKLPIYNELSRRNKDATIFRLHWPRWNLGNPEIRKNGQIISDGFQLDMDTGVLTFDSALHPSDTIEASYNFRYFSTVDMRRFLSDAMNQMNSAPPTSGYTLETVPDLWVGTLLMGATKNAMKQMLMSLSFQEPRTIFGDPNTQQGAAAIKDAIDNFKALKENNEKEFKETIENLKKKLPRAGMIVTPTHSLPGSRARWYRMMYTSGGM